MKKIKFALLLNDKLCRSLEDIRENFDAEDIIKNFDNGVLLKWLKIYNLDELYNKISQKKIVLLNKLYKATLSSPRSNISPQTTNM